MIQADRFKNLSAAVATEGRNTHLRHNLEQALIDSLHVVGGSSDRVYIEVTVVAHVGNALEGQIRVDDRSTETEQQGKVHDFADFAGLHHQTDFRTHSRFYKGAVHASRSKQRRNRHVAPIDVLVGKHDDIKALVHGTHGIASEVLQGGFQDFPIATERELHFEFLGLEGLIADVFKAADFVFGHDRARNLDEVRLLRSLFEDIAVVTDVGRKAHHQFFTNRVNRRVRHLSEQLLEVVEQRLRLVRKYGESGIVTHRADRFCTSLCHRLQNNGEVFGRVTEALLLHQNIVRNVGRIDFAKEATNAHLVFGDPATVRLATGHVSLHFGVLQDVVIFEVEVDDFTGFEAALFFDFVVGQVEYTRFRGHHEEAVFT